MHRLTVPQTLPPNSPIAVGTGGGGQPAAWGERQRRLLAGIVGSFYYHRGSPARLRRPKLGAPYYQLRFRNGYVTGIVATRRLDRFLSYGINLNRFARNGWYAVPHKMSRELRRLTIGLRPLRLTRAALAKSR